MESHASLGNNGINRQNASRESRQHVPVNSGPKDRALLPVTPFNEKRSDL
jgi:hypothetical protein